MEQMEIEEAIKKRRSIRRFKDEPLTMEEIAKLCDVALKIPSAGKRRPLLYHVVTDPNVKKKLMEAALNQQAVGSAPVVFVITAIYERTTSKYGRRGYRYVCMEAGHAGQNIALQAVSMGLGSVMIGAFRDSQVRDILGIAEDPLYIIPVGRLIDVV